MYSTAINLSDTVFGSFHPGKQSTLDHDHADHMVSDGLDFASWADLFKSGAIPNDSQCHDPEFISPVSTTNTPWEVRTCQTTPLDQYPTDCLTESVGISRRILQTSNAKRENNRLSRHAVLILDDWLSRNHASPYPSDEEKCRLEALSGLKRTQISTWFANARKRRKLSLAPTTNSAQNECEARSFPYMGPLHPFERWLTLGLDFEPASVIAIHRALMEAQTPASSTQTREDVDRCTNWQYYGGGPSSISSLEIRSYAANRSVDADQQRLRGFRSLERLERRSTTSGVRACASSEKHSSQHKRRPFQCTFCCSVFRRKHEWQRHEKSRHLPLEKWTCTPNGGTAVDSATNAIMCAFCAESDPTPSHLEEHGFASCAQRSVHERTFYRKDHLSQHLRLTHGVSDWIEPMGEWRTIPEVLRSRCGFCNDRFETWQARVDHIATHFLDGASMAEWFGDWGFDLEVMEILEHAIPPSSRQVALDATNILSADAAAHTDTNLAQAAFPWGVPSVFECSDWSSFEDWLPSLTSGDGVDYCSTAAFDHMELDGGFFQYFEETQLGPCKLLDDEIATSNGGLGWEFAPMQ